MLERKLANKSASAFNKGSASAMATSGAINTNSSGVNESSGVAMSCLLCGSKPRVLFAQSSVQNQLLRTDGYYCVSHGCDKGAE